MRRAQGTLRLDLFCTTDSPGAQGARPPDAERREGRKKEKGEKWGGGRDKFRGFFIRPFVTGPERCSLQSPKEKTDVDLEK